MSPVAHELRSRNRLDRLAAARNRRGKGGTFRVDLFDYATLKARGHHAGSGATEAACKSLIMLRAKRSGQRWTPKDMGAVLTLRSLVLDERIAPCWTKVPKDQHALEPLAA